MDYESRRDSYLDHIRKCRSCVSTYNGTRYFMSSDGVKKVGFHYDENDDPVPAKTVSQFCATAIKLLGAII